MNAARAFVDLHCHTSASFDSLASPRSVVAAAVRRGLTHLAITDHDRIDGALAALEAVERDAAERQAARREAAGHEATGDDAANGLTIIVGEEIRTRDGDLIGVFLSEAVPPGMSAAETIAAVREQGGLVGIPHPFDRFRGSLSRGEEIRSLEALAGTVDWVESWNARLMFGDGNARAADLARAAGVPGIAVSDAHTTTEVGVAFTALWGDPSTADGLRAALAAEPSPVTGRASAYVRLVTPVAKVVQRARGRGRVRPADRS